MGAGALRSERMRSRTRGHASQRLDLPAQNTVSSTLGHLKSYSARDAHQIGGIGRTAQPLANRELASSSMKSIFEASSDEVA